MAEAELPEFDDVIIDGYMGGLEGEELEAVKHNFHLRQLAALIVHPKFGGDPDQVERFRAKAADDLLDDGVYSEGESYAYSQHAKKQAEAELKGEDGEA